MSEGSRWERAGVWALTVGFGAQVLVGYSAAFGYDSALWAWHRQGVARALWGLAEVPEVAWPLMRQLCAMLGATIACWALAMLCLVRGPLRRREPWAWWAILTSFLSWFVVDTGLSARHGVWINVAFNVGAAIMTLGPLVCCASIVRTNAAARCPQG